jgi:hypothetical protein|nr:MAG TPA: helix-turn-helix domain protein [Caudoviricetes sp.]
MTEKMENLFAEIKETLNGIKADTEQSNRRTEILKKNVWNIDELAIYLRLSPDRCSRLAKDRAFPSYKQNGRYYFKREEIEAWLTANRISSVDERTSEAALRTITRRKQSLKNKKP